MANRFPRFKEIREEQGYTQKEMAKLLHISYGAYRHWERGDRNMPGDAMKDFASIVNVSLDYLVGLSRDRTLRR